MRSAVVRPASCAAVLAAALTVPLLAPSAGAAAPLRVTGHAVKIAPDGERYRSGGRYCQRITVSVTARFSSGVAYAELATKGFRPTEGMRAVSGRTVFRVTSGYGKIVCVARRGQTGEALQKTVKARGADGQTVSKLLPRIYFKVR